MADESLNVLAVTTFVVDYHGPVEHTLVRCRGGRLPSPGGKGRRNKGPNTFGSPSRSLVKTDIRVSGRNSINL